jgi:hypothetical protein
LNYSLKTSPTPRNIEAALILCLASWAFVSPFLSLFQDSRFYSHDGLYWFFPFFHLLMEGISHGEIPFWNPYSHGGESTLIPFAQQHLFSPLTLFSTWLGSSFALDPFSLSILDRQLHIGFAGLGVYLFLQRSCTLPGSRLIVFLMIFFTPFSLNAFHQNGILDHTYLIGWILFFCSRLFFDGEQKLINVVALSIFYGQSFCSYFFYGPTIAIAIFAFFAIKIFGFQTLSVPRTWRNIGCAVLLLAPMTLLNVALLLETQDTHLPVRTVSAETISERALLDTQASSTLSAFLSELDDFTSYAATATIRDLIYMFFPVLHGDPERNFSEVAIAFPFFFLLLFIAGVALGSCPQKRLMAWFCGIFLLLSFGSKGGLFSILHTVPGLSFFRHSEQLFNYYAIGVMYFVVLGFHSLWKSCSLLPKRYSLPDLINLGRLHLTRSTIITLIAVAIFIGLGFVDDRGLAPNLFPSHLVAGLFLLAIFRTYLSSRWLKLHGGREFFVFSAMTVSAFTYLALLPDIGMTKILYAGGISSLDGILWLETSTLLILVLVWSYLSLMLISDPLALKSGAEIQYKSNMLKLFYNLNRFTFFNNVTFLHTLLLLMAVVFTHQQLELIFYLIYEPYSISHKTMHDGSSYVEKRQYFLFVLVLAFLLTICFRGAHQFVRDRLKSNRSPLGLRATLVIASVFSVLWSVGFWIGLSREPIVITYAVLNLIIVFVAVSSIALKMLQRSDVLYADKGKGNQGSIRRDLLAIEPGHVFFALFSIISNAFWILTPEGMIPGQVSKHLHYSQQLFWSIFMVGSVPFCIFFLRIHLSSKGLTLPVLGRLVFSLCCAISCLTILISYPSLVDREFSTELKGTVVSKQPGQRVLRVDGFIPWVSNYWNITPQIVRYPELILRQYTAIDTYAEPKYLPRGSYNLSSYTSQPMFVQEAYREALNLDLTQSDLEILFKVNKPLASVYRSPLQVEHEADLIALLVANNSIDRLNSQVFVHNSLSDAAHESMDFECLKKTTNIDERTASSPQNTALEADVSVNSIVIENDARASGFLLVNFSYSKHWRAEVDGVPRTISRANGLFFGVPINCSDRFVQFFFDPALNKLAVFFYICVPLLGGLAILCLLCRSLFARLRSALL